MGNSNVSRAMGLDDYAAITSGPVVPKDNSAHLATGLRINNDRSARRASQDAMPSARLLLSKRRVRSPQRSLGKLPIASWSGFRPRTDDSNSTARVTVELSANTASASSTRRFGRSPFCGRGILLRCAPRRREANYRRRFSQPLKKGDRLPCSAPMPLATAEQPKVTPSAASLPEQLPCATEDDIRQAEEYHHRHHDILLARSNLLYHRPSSILASQAIATGRTPIPVTSSRRQPASRNRNAGVSVGCRHRQL